MITRGIVKEINCNPQDGNKYSDYKYFVKVYLPSIIRNNTNSFEYTRENLPVATVCALPSYDPFIKVGDIVFVGFEDNDYGRPVVLGYLYRDGVDTVGDMKLRTFEVLSKATLPEATYIGQITPEEISYLSGLHGNIQKQIDNISNSVSTLIEDSISTINKILIRSATASEWSTENPLLKLGEPGFESDTYKFKIGDGVNNWSTLPYVSGSQAPYTAGAGIQIENNEISAKLLYTVVEEQSGEKDILLKDIDTNLYPQTKWHNVIDAPDFQEKLSSVNAGANIEITQVDGVPKINATGSITAVNITSLIQGSDDLVYIDCGTSSRLVLNPTPPNPLVI